MTCDEQQGQGLSPIAPKIDKTTLMSNDRYEPLGRQWKEALSDMYGKLL